MGVVTRALISSFSLRNREAGKRASRVLVCIAATILSLIFANSARADEGLGVIPAARLSLGIAAHYGSGEVPSVHFALDATGGVIVYGAGLTPKVSYVVNAEVGYTYDDYRLHAFKLTIGAGVGSAYAAVVYAPSLVAGVSNGMTAVGMRNAIVGHFLYDIVSFEVGHQFIHRDDGFRQDFHILAGVNLGSMVFCLMQLGNVH
jgi:hypothetical protein